MAEPRTVGLRQSRKLVCVRVPVLLPETSLPEHTDSSGPGPHTSSAAFATYIDGYAVADHEALNAQLLDAIAEWRGAESGEESSNVLGWHSSRSLFTRPEPAFQVLRRHIVRGLVTSMRRYWPDFDPTRHKTVLNGWVNVNQQHALNAPHDHGGAHLSGTYYVSVPKQSDAQSGVLEFLNPAASSARLPNGRFMAKPKFVVRPEAGRMVIFPAHLVHWVYPNLEEEDRVSIAFNLRVIGD